MYMGFFSDALPNNNVTDYLVRVVKPKLDSIEGVQTAELLGARTFALRAWLDASKLAAHGVTAADVSAALGTNNFLAALGSSKGQMVTVPLRAGTDLHSVEEFKKLAVKQSGDAIVRLEDVATVTLGSDNYDFNVAFSGVRSVFIGIKVAPQANILDVAKRVRDAFPDLKAQLPSGLTGEIVYDSTEFINTSIVEVIKTLVEALLIVTLVIYLFLGSLRAVVVPVIAMPLSLIGTFFVMLVLGYSINLLTLLALVLAIGLVVDDAIIVVENVDRHMKEGKPPMQAALMAARELGSPIIAMTVVLIAVYVPDRLPGRPHGRALHRVRVHAGRRGDRVGHRRADAVADDVLAHVQAGAGQRAVRASHRSYVRAGARPLPAHPAQPARHLAGADRDGRDPEPAACGDVQDVAVRARARGRPGDRALVRDRPADRHRRPDANLRRPGFPGGQGPARIQRRCSRSPACPP